MAYKMLEFLMISILHLERSADIKMKPQLLARSEFFMSNSINKDIFLHLCRLSN